MYTQNSHANQKLCLFTTETLQSFVVRSSQHPAFLCYRRLNLTILRSFKLDPSLQRSHTKTGARPTVSRAGQTLDHQKYTYLHVHMNTFWNSQCRSLLLEAVRHGYFVTRKSHNSDFIKDITGKSKGRIRTSVSLHSLLEPLLVEQSHAQTPPSHEEKGQLTIERFLGCAESSLDNPMKQVLHYASM